MLTAIVDRDIPAALSLLERRELIKMAAHLKTSTEELEAAFALYFSGENPDEEKFTDFAVYLVREGKNAATVFIKLGDSKGFYNTELSLVKRRGRWYVDPRQYYSALYWQDERMPLLFRDAYLSWHWDTPPSLRADPPGWEELKKYFNGETISYLESIKPANLSGKSLSASICHGGQIKLATGWLCIEESRSGLDFTYEPVPWFTE